MWLKAALEYTETVTLRLGKAFHICEQRLWGGTTGGVSPKSNPACQSRQMTGGAEEYAERLGRILQEGC